jgi:UDP-glucuronate decarboxylase
VETLRVNAEGTRHLLELAARDGAKFLYCSTSEAYGDPLEHPQREEYRGNVSSTGPRSMYDEAKRYGEALTFAYIRTRQLDARVVRIFNTYGPRSDPNDGRLVPNLFVQAILGRQMTVYGDGTQTRSLCYVTDTVEGIVRAMERPRTSGEVINIGNPDEHTVAEFAAIIRRVAGSASPIVQAAQAVGDDPQRRRPDIAKARALLGFEPRVGLEEGLELACAWFAAELGVPAPMPARAKPVRRDRGKPPLVSAAVR